MDSLDKSLETMIMIVEHIIISKENIMAKFGVDAKTIEKAIKTKKLHKPHPYAGHEFFNTEHVEMWIESMDNKK